MELVYNAGPVVKLVLLILVYFSVVSWAIIFYKQMVVHRAIRDSDRFLDFFWSKKRFDAIGQGLEDFRHSPLTVLFREVYSELAQSRRQTDGQVDDNLVADLGEQERVAVVRAIVNEPPILLADEPTGNLDPELSLEIMQLFAQFNQVGVTLLIATHDIDLIQRFDKRIIQLRHGRVSGDHVGEQA